MHYEKFMYKYKGLNIGYINYHFISFSNLELSFLMRWVFMHIALKGCSPPHTNEPVQFWIGFGLVLIGGSGLNPLGLLTPYWIIQQVIDRNASRRHMGPIYSSDVRSRAKRRWTKSKIDFCFLCMNLLTIDSSLKCLQL